MIKRLYHGSITKFDEIDVFKEKGYKDFGQGFYTTGVKDHAVRLAKRNKRIAEDRLSMVGKKNEKVIAYLYEYDFDNTLLEKYKAKKITKKDREWVLFVLENRASKTKVHNYDIVKGPTADDNTRIIFNTYKNGGYGDPKSDIAIRMVLKLLESDNLPLQLYFGTNNSVKELVFRGRTEIV